MRSNPKPKGKKISPSLIRELTDHINELQAKERLLFARLTILSDATSLTYVKVIRGRLAQLSEFASKLANL